MPRTVEQEAMEQAARTYFENVTKGNVERDSRTVC